MIAVVRGVLALWAPLGAADGTTPGGEGDTVTIVTPNNDSYFPDAPATVEVMVEVVNNTTLEIQEVRLQIDGQDETSFCEQAGPCAWTLELVQGEYDLRSYAVRNIGGPLFSQFVAVQVGGEPPDSAGDSVDETGAPPRDTSDTSGTTATGDVDAGPEQTGGMPDAEPDPMSDSGCGCASSGAGPFGANALPWAWLALVVLGTRRARPRARLLG